MIFAINIILFIDKRFFFVSNVTLMEELIPLATKLKKRVRVTIAQPLQQWFYSEVRNKIFIVQLYNTIVDIVTPG